MMNGLPVGSGVVTATIPRERGLSTQADSVNPCAGGAEQPLLLEHDRDHVELDVRRLQVAAGAREAAVLADVGRQRALALHPLGEVRVVERVLERGLLLAEVRHARGRVVLEVHADLGRLGDELDLQQLELLRPTDPRERQQLRRVVSAAAHDHLALGLAT